MLFVFYRDLNTIYNQNKFRKIVGTIYLGGGCTYLDDVWPLGVNKLSTIWINGGCFKTHCPLTTASLLIICFGENKNTTYLQTKKSFKIVKNSRSPRRFSGRATFISLPILGRKILCSHCRVTFLCASIIHK